MKTRILQIFDRGVPYKERLAFSVINDCKLDEFIVFNTKYENPSAINARPLNTFWFTSKLVKAGDEVVLYTGSGISAETDKPDGTKIHTFYWGLQNTLWNTTGDCAVLFEINNWQTTLFE